MKDRVIKIVSQVMRIPAEQISEGSSYEDIERWDSLQHMNLILALEEEFKVKFTDEEIVKSLSIKIILDTLKDKGIV